MYKLLLVTLLLAGCGGFAFTASTDTSDAGEPNMGDDAGAPSSGGSSSKGSGGKSSVAPEGGSGGSEDDVSGGSGGEDTGTGGSDLGGAGGDGSDVTPICDPGVTQCASKTFKTCNSDGSKWTSESCDYVCDETQGCVGVCTPGNTKCDGTDSQTCNEAGVWVTTQTCTYVCSGEGVCSGSCVPNSEACHGNDSDLCNSEGTWETQETCSYACNFSGGNASCGGECSNGDKQCNSKTPQTCVNHAWVNGTTCDYLCTGEGNCTGVCTPGDTKCNSEGAGGSVQTCNASGQWVTATNACPFVCSAGSCGGVCVPGSEVSTGECTKNVCKADGSGYTGTNKSNGTSCGSSSDTACDNPNTCQTGVCQNNYETNGTSCNGAPSGTCDAQDTCNGSGTCVAKYASSSTVCQTPSCSSGNMTQGSMCTGSSTTCPTPPAPTSCYGSCNAGGNACEVTGLNHAYTASSPLNALADNSTSVFVVEGLTNRGITKVAKSNFASSSIYTGTSVSAIYASDSAVYFTEAGSLYCIPANGGTRQTVATNHNPYRLTSDGSTLFWSTFQNAIAGPNEIWTTPLTACTTTATITKIFTSSGKVMPRLVTVGKYLYFLEDDGSVVLTQIEYAKCPGPQCPVGGVSQDSGGGLFTAINPWSILLSSGSTLYFFTENAGSRFWSASAPADGALTSAVSKNSMSYVGSSAWIVGSSHIYMGNKKLPLAGNASTSLWVQHSVSDADDDATNVYFTSTGYWTSLNNPSETNDVSVYGLYRIAK